MTALVRDYPDVWRHLHPDASDGFTVWNEKTSARAFNAGGSMLAGARHDRLGCAHRLLYAICGWHQLPCISTVIRICSNICSLPAALLVCPEHERQCAQTSSIGQCNPCAPCCLQGTASTFSSCHPTCWTGWCRVRSSQMCHPRSVTRTAEASVCRQQQDAINCCNTQPYDAGGSCHEHCKTAHPCLKLLGCGSCPAVV